MVTPKERNLKTLLFGIFFTSLSVVFANTFLPFFLKEQGFSALQIGGLFTLSIAVGSLLFSTFFSVILRKIKLRTSLVISGILCFFRTFVLYVFPTAGGAAGNQILSEVDKPIYRISVDTTIQHNLIKGRERHASIGWGVADGIGLVLGLILSIILVPRIGFRNAFLIFSLLAIPSIFLFSKIDDSTRFRPKKSMKLPDIPSKLRWLLFSEIIYWFALASSFSLVITFLVSDKLSGGLTQLGLLFIGLYVSMTLTMILTKNYFDNSSDVAVSVFGMLFLLASAVIVIVSHSFYVVLGAFVLEGIGAGIWVPSKTALQWKYTRRENREKVAGWLHGWRGFVSALGPLAGGFLITFMGINSPFYLKGIVSIISISIYIYVARKN